MANEEFTFRRLIDYYKDCNIEEAKSSALRNLYADKSNIVLELPEEDKLFSMYPTPAEYPHIEAEVLDMKFRAESGNTQQLFYARGLVDGYLDGKRYYAPLYYTPCTIVREGNRTFIKIEGNYKANLGLLANRLSGKAQEDQVVLNHYTECLPQLPCSKEDLAKATDRIKYLNSHGCLQGLSITLNKNFLVLANFGKATVNWLKDMNYIFSQTDMTSSLSAIQDAISNEVKAPLPMDFRSDSFITLCEAQKEALQAIGKTKVLAIQGGPGCGKTTTIKKAVSRAYACGLKVLVVTKNQESLGAIKRGMSTPACCIAGASARKKFAYSAPLQFNTPAPPNNCGDYDKERYSRDVKTYLKNYEDAKKYERISIEKYGSKNPIDWLIRRYAIRKAAEALTKEGGGDWESPISSAEFNLEWHADYVRNALMRDNPRYRRSTLLVIKSWEKHIVDTSSDIYIQAFKDMLECFPVVFANFNDVSDVIPVVENLFDMVIIDEASQCSIGEAIPSLYRAKTAVIVGDDKQLRSLSFLDKKFNEAVLRRALQGEHYAFAPMFDTAKNTLYDLATFIAGEGGVKLLWGQFRGTRELMQFANDNFYGGQLVHELNSYQRDVDERAVVGGVYLPYSDIIVNTVEGGEVTKKKPCNYKEASQIVEKIIKLISTSKYTRSYSIGVVTPFRAQADLINKMLKQRLTPQEIEEHEILVGTAHAFQGHERDYMFISWVVTEQSAVQSFTFINNPNVFNVTITRAERAIYNYISFDPSKIPDGYLKRYICQNYYTCGTVRGYAAAGDTDDKEQQS